MSLYEESDAFRLFIGMMNGIAFLPLDDVARGMNFLQTVGLTRADELLYYFDSTYVNGTFLWITMLEHALS